MCLILFSYRQHPKYPLIVVANRDEFYERPTAQAHWWEEFPEMLAGKDLVGNGSWFGMSKTGKFSALTNYRDGFNIKKNAPTRGKLVTNFLTQEVSPKNYLEDIAETGHLYNGYNLLTFDGTAIWHYSNINNEITEISSGTHGLSNALLNSNWPKINQGKTKLAELVQDENFDIEAAFAMMLDETQPVDEDLPSTGVPIEWERKLSSMCIKTENYGTRCSTVMLWDNKGHVYFEERSYVPALESKKYKVQTFQQEILV